MAQNTIVLTDTSRGIHEADFARKQVPLVDPASGSTHLRASKYPFQIERRTLGGGVCEGVDAIEIDNGTFRFVVVPTRGMGLWKGWLGETEIGWQSPVKGPVHPNFVPLSDPSGLGWLEGFDELLCRCGLESNGSPDFGPTGVWKYPLHGRIANRPAHYVAVTTNEDTGEISLTGVVDETRFLFQKLRLTSSYVTKVGQKGLRVVDEVTNLSGNPAEMQLLYHINFGTPLLDPGARVIAPVKAVVPRDPRAAEGIGAWESYANEQAGYSEQVYFFELLADSKDRTQVLLKNAHGTQGVSLRYSKQQLPYFTLWKNTALAADGYVTGLEPGTNFPNPRSFEAQQGRVVKLPPGGTVRFEVELEVHPDAQSVAGAEQAIAKIQGSVQPQVFNTPQAGWTRTEKA